MVQSYNCPLYVYTVQTIVIIVVLAGLLYKVLKIPQKKMKNRLTKGL